MSKTLYYHPASTPVRAVRLLAKQLGVKYTLKHVALEKGEQLSPTFLAMNPQHCVPTFDDEGFVLCESRAILGYLVDTYAKSDSLFPKDPKKRAEVNQRLYFDIGSVVPKVGNYLKCLLDATDPTETLKGLNEALSNLNGFLEGKDWVACNQKTIADYSLVPSVSNLEVSPAIDMSKYPNVVAWMKRAKEEFIDYDELNQTGVNAIRDYFKNNAVKK